MANGHGIMINMGSYLPFSFIFNPTEVETKKEIEYVEVPNIGGSHKEMYFIGFGNKKVNFSLVCIDMENPVGVTPEVAYFDSLREPDAGIFGIAAISSENYPPPQVLFGFGTGDLVPLIWNVSEVQMVTSMFYSGTYRGVLGIPKRLDIDIELTLDEESILYKSNQISKKALQIGGSALSIIKEGTNIRQGGNKRKEQMGILRNIRLDY